MTNDDAGDGDQAVPALYSFGGWKDSLFGDLHAHGTDGMQFITHGRSSPPAGTPSAGLELSFPSNR